MKSINVDKFCQDIQQSELLSIESTNPEYILEQYDNTLLSILDKHAPLITKTIIKHEKVPWFNKTIAAAKTSHRRAEKKVT